MSSGGFLRFLRFFRDVAKLITIVMPGAGSFAASTMSLISAEPTRSVSAMTITRVSPKSDGLVASINSHSVTSAARRIFSSGCSPVSSATAFWIDLRARSAKNSSSPTIRCTGSMQTIIEHLKSPVCSVLGSIRIHDDFPITVRKEHRNAFRGLDAAAALVPLAIENNNRLGASRNIIDIFFTVHGVHLRNLQWLRARLEINAEDDEQPADGSEGFSRMSTNKARDNPAVGKQHRDG